MEDTVLQRVKEVIRFKSKSVLAFSKAIGMGQNTLNQYVNGSRKLSLEAVLKILYTFEDVSAEWLIRGIGTMTALPENEDGKIQMSNAQAMALIASIKTMATQIEDLNTENIKLKEQLAQATKSRKKA